MKEPMDGVEWRAGKCFLWSGHGYLFMSTKSRCGFLLKIKPIKIPGMDG